MIVAAAVCPGAPLLVSGLAPTLAGAVPRLVASCAAAVGVLRATDRILLVTSGPRVRDRGVRTKTKFIRHEPGTAVSSSALGDSRSQPAFSSRLAGGRPEDGPGRWPPGVGVVVGAALLEATGVDIPTTAIELGDPDDPAETDQCPEVLAAVGGSAAERIGLLIIGEGSASRGSDSPGGGHDGAQAFDARVAAALATGDPAALGAAVRAGRRQAKELVWTSGPSLGALAGLCAQVPPSCAALLYDEAPFGVGYLVATWTWA
ncbi:hypothetical protein [Nakamurella sp. PAMC28650]|uniref:hypothetical protein n=1 Tax=Nakamurella sp. PAMC28650 TaxID=2762325 RepID=UPI00164E79A2|nr:hypothetical protein [Nakamurella sp. PAMC28650]QNK83385.1 hypothetical protein H7F38_12615 [Nakamurella sp. PAMC28650]